MADKVYCSECKNLIETYQQGKPAGSKCAASQNKRTVDSPMGRKEVFEGKPDEINKNNDCKWFVSRKPVVPKEEKRVSVGMSTILDHEKRITALEAKKGGKPPKKE